VILNKLNSILKPILLFLLSFNICYAKTDQCLNFGDNIEISTKINHLSYGGNEAKNRLDLNDDGILDRVILLSISKRSKIAPDVKISNPFKPYQTKEAELLDQPHLAIGIIHSATKTSPCKKFVLYNNFIFDEWGGIIDRKITVDELLIAASAYFHNILLIHTSKIRHEFVVSWNGKDHEAYISEYPFDAE
jgi:hypothetical protein